MCIFGIRKGRKNSEKRNDNGISPREKSLKRLKKR